MISSATRSRSSASTGNARPARNSRPARVRRSSGRRRHRGDRGWRGSAGPRWCVQTAACCAAARASATDAHARAGTTPPAAAPRTAAGAATWRPRDRSGRSTTPQRAGLDRLGQVRHRPGPLQAPADKQPARARLNRDMDLPPREPIHPLPNRSRSGLQLTAPQLTGHGVQRVNRDLPTMHITPGDDRPRGNAQHEGGAQHRLRGVTPDRCHTVIHGRYLQLRMTGGAAATAHAFNQRRSTRRTGHLPPGPPGRNRPGCSCHL